MHEIRGLKLSHALDRLLQDIGLAHPTSPTPHTNLLQRKGCRLTSSAFHIPTELVQRLCHSTSTRALLDAIATLALEEPFTVITCKRFQKIILDLVGRWLQFCAQDNEHGNEKQVKSLVLKIWHAFSKIIGIWPEIFPLFTIFMRHPLLTTPSGFEAITTSDSSVLSLFRILHSLPAFPQSFITRTAAQPSPGWTFPKFITKLMEESPHRGIRILAWHCAKRWKGWTAGRGLEMRQRYIVSGENIPLPRDEDDDHISWEAVVNETNLKDTRSGLFMVTEIRIDAWLADYAEWERIQFHSTREDEVDDAIEDEAMSEIIQSDLSPWVRILDNQLVVNESSFTSQLRQDFPLHDRLVSSSALQLLTPICSSLKSRHPLLFHVPPSSHIDVTQLISQVAEHVGAQPPVIIDLGDKTLDGRSLLGGYTSADPTSDELFSYHLGTLATAVKTGRWVVLTSLDKMLPMGSVECVIRELTERIDFRASDWKVGGAWGGWGHSASAGIWTESGMRGNWIGASTGFMLFGISQGNKSWIGKEYWYNSIDVPPYTNEEVQQVVQSKLGDFTWVKNIVAAWKLVGGTAAVDGLTKWISRIKTLNLSSGIVSLDFNPIIQEEIYLDALDVFCSAQPTQEMAALQLASVLGINSERAQWILNRRTPEVHLPIDFTDKMGVRTETQSPILKVGRARIACRPSQDKSSRPFALTRPSLLLLERLISCVNNQEPVLLVGETGTGKTTAVGRLAEIVGKKLTVLNLSTQTEVGDLLGGLKPVNDQIQDVSGAAAVMVNRFIELFSSTFDSDRNAPFVDAMNKAFGRRRYARLVQLWNEAAKTSFAELNSRGGRRSKLDRSMEFPQKKQKLESDHLWKEWEHFMEEVYVFDMRFIKKAKVQQSSTPFKFGFVDGPLVHAMKEGHWILLDEINLASFETLEAITPILQSSTASIILTEKGDLNCVPRHPDFRFFACMNPATDVGKKDLPQTMKERLTTFYVASPDEDKESLLKIVNSYIGRVSAVEKGLVLDVVTLYIVLRSMTRSGEIADGSNQPPHYSMRTLVRALTFAVENAPLYGIRRSIYEGILLAFSTSLEPKSLRSVRDLVDQHIITPAKNARSTLMRLPARPKHTQGQEMIALGQYWVETGPLERTVPQTYVMTDSVQRKKEELSRAILARKYPVLIQGPTASGKTSIIEYLAKEYLGSYVSDPKTGKLKFQEGLLVQAVRRGDWLVLDELNLAPTDVLEALNRLLDDNRELFIPETQEIVRPHPHFMLFATQNPPGLYGGRKILSRAFRNRFLEFHFDEVPQSELEEILSRSCSIAPSHAGKIVTVFLELQRHRQISRVFEQNHSFATLRDLFRWAGRHCRTISELAEHGYMLIAERSRDPEDVVVIKKVIEDVMKVSLDTEKLYGIARLEEEPNLPGELAWTAAMRRLYILVSNAIRRNEPVLLVGETGTGKTSICQAIAEAFGHKLHIIGCHMNSETSDFLGSQRPVRNRETLVDIRSAIHSFGAQAGIKHLPFFTDLNSCSDFIDILLKDDNVLPAQTREEAKILKQRVTRAMSMFEWQDGPLVHAMKSGAFVLLDEISLADDSVLERLNSVLEPSRSLVLTEIGGDNLDHFSLVAAPGFQIFGTMNPGGDYGKKELSPALRNRFTEIWVPPIASQEDFLEVMRSRTNDADILAACSRITQFFRWFENEYSSVQRHFGLRDALSWVDFMERTKSSLGVAPAFIHASLLVCTDALPSTILEEATRACESKASAIIGLVPFHIDSTPEFSMSPDQFRLGIFSLPRISNAETSAEQFHFSFSAPTTQRNAFRILRALQISKPILLEGDPGVGKTSLVVALGAMCGVEVVRINLSDHTDLADLFGNDMPSEDGTFIWKDAPFLSALKNGSWVLLDELNLAPQTVLEGLNSCLDHRKNVYIPELDRVFYKHTNCRIFATQNPLAQGGGRKGLPKSFLNRFSIVSLQTLQEEDILTILQTSFPELDPVIAHRMALCNTRFDVETRIFRSFGQVGSPWEFNIRDSLRWISLLLHPGTRIASENAKEQVELLYIHRFRNATDRSMARKLLVDIFGSQQLTPPPSTISSETFIQFCWQEALCRQDLLNISPTSNFPSLPNDVLAELRSVTMTMEKGWLVILESTTERPMLSLMRNWAALKGASLRELDMDSSQDTSELLGSFEQDGLQRRFQHAMTKILTVIMDACKIHEDFVDLLPEVNHLLFNAKGSHVDTVNAIHLLDTTIVRSVDGSSTKARLEKIRQDFVTSDCPKKGAFVWEHGTLVKSMLNGDWLLLRNANFCNQAVLDRLNSVFENNGRLNLNERGAIDGKVLTICAHSNFRMILLLDPSKGQLSRAMRNRGVEVFLPSNHYQNTNLRYQNMLYEQSLSRITEMRLGQKASVMNDSLANFQHLLASLPPALYGITERLDGYSSTFSSQRLDLSRASTMQLLSNLSDYYTSLCKIDLVTPHLPLDLATLPSHYFGSDEHRIGSMLKYHSASIYTLAVCLSTEMTNGAEIESVLRQFLIELTGISFEALDTNITWLLYLAGAYLRHLQDLGKDASLNKELIAQTIEWIELLLRDVPPKIQSITSTIIELLQRAKLGMKRRTGQLFEAFWSASLNTMRVFDPEHCGPLVLSRFEAPRLDELAGVISQFLTTADSRPLTFLKERDMLQITSNVFMRDEEIGSYEEIVAFELQLSRYIDGLIEPSYLTHLLQASQYISLGSFWNCSRIYENYDSRLEGLSNLLEYACCGPEGVLKQSASWRPSTLLTPHALVLLSRLNPNPVLDDLENCQKQYRSLFDVQRLARNCLQYSRSFQLARLFFVTVDMICLVAEGNSQGPLCNSLNGPENATGLMQRILNRSSASSHDEYRRLFCHFVSPHARLLLTAIEEGVENYSAELGTSFLALGRLIWHLVVPNYPVDPVASSLHRGRFLSEEICHLDHSIYLEHQRLYISDSPNPRTRILEHWKHQLQEEEANLAPPPLSRSSSPTSLSALFKDLDLFRTHIIRDDLLDSLQHGNMSPEACEISESLYTSVQSAAKRFFCDHGHFMDIIRPVSLSFWTLQIGLSILSKVYQKNISIETAFIENLVTFPTVAISTDGLDVNNSLFKDLPEVGIFRLALCIPRQDKRRDMDDEISMFSTYMNLYSQWQAIQGQQEIDQIENNKFFKIKPLGHLHNDEDDDDGELRRVFPTYDDNDVEVSISSSWWSTLWELHSAIWIGKKSSESIKILHRSRHKIIQLFCQMTGPFYTPDALDIQSLAFQTATIYRLVNELHGTDAASPDFYTEANIPETSRAVPIIKKLQDRLFSLLVQFPEQAILAHLQERCNLILKLSCTSSIMRVLTAIEQLLDSLEDWERYADRLHSLEYHRSELIALVLTWRRAELHSWSTLLSKEDQNFNADLDEWVLRLFSIVVSTIDTDLREVISTLRMFLEESNVGQFHERLQAVLSFVQFAKVFRHIPQVSICPSIYEILSNIYMYYTQFADKIENERHTIRGRCQTELSDIIILASWKDTTVLALRESAKKSHSRLFSQIRKYRRALQVSSNQFFALPPHQAQSLPFNKITRNIVPTSHIVEEQPITNEFQKLSKLWYQVCAVVEGRLSEPMSQDWASDIELFSTTILQTIDQLKNDSTANPTPAAERNLVRMKRKAWSDLLKQLRVSGLPFRPSADFAASLRDDKYLYTLPVLDDLEFMDLIHDYRRYHYHILHLLPLVHASIVNSQVDILSGDFEKAIGYIDSCSLNMFGMLGPLCTLITKFRFIDGASNYLHYLLEADIVQLSSSTSIKVQSVSTIFHQILDALHELQQMVNISCDGTSPKEQRDQGSAFSEIFNSIVVEIEQHVELLQSLSTRLVSFNNLLCTSSDVSVLRNSLIVYENLTDAMSRVLIMYPTFSYVVRPTYHWISSLRANFIWEIEVGTSTVVESNSNLLNVASSKIVDQTLIVVQDLTRVLENDYTLSKESDVFLPKGFLQNPSKLAHRMVAIFRVSEFASSVENFVGALSEPLISEAIRLEIQRSLPFIQTYRRLLHQTIVQYLHLAKTMGKFIYILSNTVLTLAKDGFCRSDADVSSVEDTKGELESGTGLGQGTGSKDISDQISDKDELDGLQGESQSTETMDNSKTSTDPVDMEGNFDGEDTTVDQDEDADGNRSENECMDETMSSVDPLESSAVDEKFWEGVDTKDEESRNEEAGTSKQSREPESNTNTNTPKRMEGDFTATLDGETQEEGQQPETDHTENANTSDVESDAADNIESDDIHQPGELPENLNIPEAERLDLPEDMDMDRSVEKEMDIDGTDDLDSCESLLEGTDLEENKMDYDESDTRSDKITEIGTEEEHYETNPEDPAMEPASGTDLGGAASSGGDPNKNANNIENQPSSPRQDIKQTLPSALDISMDEGSFKDGNAAPQEVPLSETMAEKSDPSTNLQRTVDHIIDDVKRHLREIQQITELGRLDETNSQGNLTYADAQELPNDMSALGAATQDQLDEYRRQTEERGSAELIEQDMIKANEFQSPMQPHVDPDVIEIQNNMPSMKKETQPTSIIRSEKNGGDACGVDNSDPWSQSSYMSLDWLIDIDGPVNANGLWNHYLEKTSQSSFELTEQLRLILEPTLATRLRGDYRTGKRLNMKKLIPFVASDFKKDKIWLRRTQPSQREFNILLAIDDSKSMREGNTVDLTFRALAIIMQGLEQLEVGQVGLANFGGDVKIIKPINESKIEGDQIVRSFSFNQEKTDIALLLETSMKEFSSVAPLSSTATDLWQLEIIISDGHCQDHGRLRQLLRKAKEQKILIVFITVDSLHRNSVGETESILSLNSLSYAMKADGSGMEVKLERYMDSFPFEYYVVLQDVSLLPQILTGVLRQFFETVSSN